MGLWRAQSATKWAVPGAASTATHAIILARLTTPPPPPPPSPEPYTTTQAKAGPDTDAKHDNEADTKNDNEVADAKESGAKCGSEAGDKNEEAAEAAPPGPVDQGLQAFVVQLRRLDDGALLPGVHCGPCPDPAGADLDLGFIQLTAVHVPIDALLSKYAAWEPGGDEKPPGLAAAEPLEQPGRSAGRPAYALP